MVSGTTHAGEQQGATQCSQQGSLQGLLQDSLRGANTVGGTRAAADDAPDNWAAYALCATETVDLFVRGAAQNKAKAICQACPVRKQCLAEALDNRIEWGVWGGMTERERRALLRRRPHVTDWEPILAQAS